MKIHRTLFSAVITVLFAGILLMSLTQCVVKPGGGTEPESETKGETATDVITEKAQETEAGPSGERRWNDWGYQAAFTYKEDGSLSGMTLTGGGDDASLIFGVGDEWHALVVAYRTAQGAVFVQTLQETYYLHDADEKSYQYAMNAIGYAGLHQNESDSAFVGLWEDNESKTAASIAMRGNEVQMTINRGLDLLDNAARYGKEFIVLLDYDSARPAEENRLMVCSDSFSETFDWRIGKEKGVINAP